MEQTWNTFSVRCKWGRNEEKYLWVLWILHEFFQIRIVRVLQGVSDPTWIFSSTFSINFTFVWWRDVSFLGIFFYKMNLFFKWSSFFKLSFLSWNCQILSVFLYGFTFFNSFRIRSYRIRNDYFRIRILLKVSNLAWSGSTIQNFW